MLVPLTRSKVSSAVSGVYTNHLPSGNSEKVTEQSQRRKQVLRAMRTNNPRKPYNAYINSNRTNPRLPICGVNYCSVVRTPYVLQPGVSAIVWRRSIAQPPTITADRVVCHWLPFH